MPTRRLAIMWRWHQIEWHWPQLLTELRIDAPGAEGFVSTYDTFDDLGFPADPIYYIGDAGRMRRAASQEDACAHPAPLTPSPDAVWRFDDLPRCRYVRVYHRRLGETPYVIRGIFPRRLSSD